MGSALDRCAQAWEDRLRQAGLVPLVDPREPPALTPAQAQLVTALIADLRPRLRAAQEGGRPPQPGGACFRSLATLGLALLHRGRRSRRYGQAVRVLSDALACNPNRGLGYRLRGQAYVVQGTNHPKWMVQARQDLRRALRFDQTDEQARFAFGLSFYLPARDQHRQAQQLRLRGQRRRAARQVARAEEGLEQAVQQYHLLLHQAPDHGLARLARGTALALLGQLEAALRDFDYLDAGGDPFGLPGPRGGIKRRELHLERGRVRAALQLVEPALADFARALAPATPTSGAEEVARAARLARAELAQRAGRSQLAVEDLCWAIEREPSPPAELILRRAECYHALGDEPRARADTARILAVEPDNLAARCLRGACNLRSGSLQSALADFDWCLAVEPGHRMCRSLRAEALLALGQGSPGPESVSRAARKNLD